MARKLDPVKRGALRGIILMTDWGTSSRSVWQKVAYNVGIRVLRDGVGPVEFTDDNGHRFVLHPHHVIDRQLLRQGVWEPHVTREIRARLRPGQVFYDVGANIGYDTLLAASRVGREGRVVAFEPFPTIADRLRDHLALNSVENVQVVQACVTATAQDEVTLFVPPSSLPNPGRATLGADPDFEPMRCDAIQIDEAVADGRIPPPDVVKIDVEGFELDVLSSMRRQLDRDLTLIVEITRVDGRPEEVTEYLADLGYRIAFESPPHRFEREGVPHEQTDAVFVR